MRPESEQPLPSSTWDLATLVERGAVSADWAEALRPVQGVLRELGAFLDSEQMAGHAVLPEQHRILRAFEQPLAQVRVLIVGQDPYPTVGHPVGLAFAVDSQVRPLPRSLSNVFRELQDDLGIAAPRHGDLSAWSDQGVMLLNRVLTVRSGEAGSHRARGWERVTDCAIDALVQRGAPLVAILWGKDAQTLAPRFGTLPIIESAHPSPLSARRGFFGSRPFSRANAHLIEQDAQAIEWQLNEEAGPLRGEGRLF